MPTPNETPINSVFASVEYNDSELLSRVKDAANKKFGERNSYVKNLWVLREYKKRGGKVKYSGKKPSGEQIKENVKKDVERLRSQASIEVDLTETSLSFFLKKEFEFVEASIDEDIKSLKDDLQTFQYCYGEDDFMKDFLEAEAGEKKQNVKLNKPFRTPGGPKKFAVYVRNNKGNIVLVRFGDPESSIKSSDPERLKSFRARHGCDNPGPKTGAKFWSCFMWRKNKKVSDIVANYSEADFKDVFPNCEEISE